MENASKALIIAGAILLSILIIALGMRIYNNASSSIGQADLSATEVQAHNAQFLSYEGRQSGTQVRALVNAIKSNNAQYQDRMVKITWSKIAASTKVVSSGIATYDASTASDDNNYNTITSELKSTTTYFVTFNYMDNGTIGGVDIHVYSDVDL